MLNILQCTQVCELQFWKQFVYCKLNLCSVKELLLKIKKNFQVSSPFRNKMQHLEYF